MRGPALYQLFNVRRADVAQTSLQAALLRPFVLQAASQGIWANNETMSSAHGTLEMRAGCEESLRRKASQQDEREMLKQSSCPAGKAGGSLIHGLWHMTATYRTDGQNPQGGRMSAEPQEPPSSYPAHSFPQYPASCVSPRRI